MLSRLQFSPGRARKPFPESPSRGWTLPCLVAAMLVLAPAAFAQGEARGGPENYRDPTDSHDYVDGSPLSLAEAIALGLRNNLDVEVNRYAPYIAGLESEAAWGAFDPFLSSGVGYNEKEQPLTSPFGGTQDDSIQGSVGVTALVPYLGATVGLEFTSAKSESDSPFAGLSPRYDAGLEFTGDVPLMKGLLWNAAWTQVRSSKLGASASNADFETSVMNTVQGVITGYWRLVATKEQRRVAEKALETSQALLDQTQTQYDVGVVSKVDVVEAEAGVANREFELIVARNNYQNANDTLIATLLGRRLRASTSIVFSPTDNPAYETAQYIDVESAVATAFEQRPEIRSFEDRIGQAKVSEKFARNQRLPDLSFTFRHKSVGIDGDNIDPNFGQVPPQPPIVTPGGDYGDSLSQLYSGNHDWTVGGRFTIPIPNTAARKQLSKAEFELRRAESQRTRFKQGVIVEIRAAARGLIASAQGVEAAERGRTAAAEQLRAEQIRLEHGESTPFDVLQRQNDLVSAESRKVGALQAFRDSQAALERAQGTILEVHAVQIQQVRTLE